MSRETGLVAAREVRERFRGRLFRTGTLIILAGATAAILIPALTKGGGPHTQRVGVVGPLAAPLREAVAVAAVTAGTTARFVPEPDVAAARGALRSTRLDLAIVDARELLVNKAIRASDASAWAQFVRIAAASLGIDEAFEGAGLPAPQAAQVTRARALPVASLQRAARPVTSAASIIGLILVFFMLTQYNTWTLMGVMEEKSGRVAEVLLAAIRPAQLLAGKVLGIGLVAFAQATLVVVVAIGLAQAVGSGLLHGTAPVVLLSTLLWLVLGYAFYSWVYAAAGSMAERRDQVQSLVLPLSLPILFGYFTAQTVLVSGYVSTFFHVLGYLPPTAPFAMPVLVALGRVTWWEFTASALISVGCTVGVARLAIGVYRRAILRTGRRVPLREALLPALGRRPPTMAG